ncbi:hypothetical protein P3X46_017889 [Hevea brasiliensis]|uniref:F-box domain-containing protein n=1 Tax=Hevea brasiliensis TaxID=3981 RepID=A0ABQ9LT20_HEVBR|nr:hypothetical protein P3X46_017889 [Hevea brasiliensis]
MSEPFSSISCNLTLLILSHVPIPSLLRAFSFGKLWHSLISTLLSIPSPTTTCLGSSSTVSTTPPPRTTSTSLLTLPPTPGFVSLLFPSLPMTSLAPMDSSFLLLLLSPFPLSSPLRFSRINPLIGVLFDPKTSQSHISMLQFIVVGGVRFIGNLVDIEDRLAVDIYDPCCDSWDLCSPLPANFRPGNSSQTLSSAMFKGRFFVFEICTFFVSFFDLGKHVWSQVQTLRPPGLLFAFLIACQEMLVLAGMIDEKSMEFSEIAIMPQDLLYGLVDSKEEDKFASLKCVGMGNLIYVYNEEYHKMYPACICEIISESGNCSWRKVPPLPSPFNKFHKVISFCSTVMPHNIFLGEEEEIGLVEPMSD